MEKYFRINRSKENLILHIDHILYDIYILRIPTRVSHRLRPSQHKYTVTVHVTPTFIRIQTHFIFGKPTVQMYFMLLRATAYKIE